MKKIVKLFGLTVFCSMLFAAAVEAEEEQGVYDVITMDTESVSLQPQLADGTAVQKEEAVINGETVEDCYKNSVRMELQYSDVVDGSEYVVLVTNGENVFPSVENVVYIDQATASGGKVTYNLYPSLLEDGMKYYVYLSSDSDTMEGLNEVANFNYGIIQPAFGEVDFTLPAETIMIEESAFEGVGAECVYVPDSCISIGAGAFRNSSVKQIRIPENCTIEADAFTGCDAVQIFGKPGSDAEAYCSNHANCTFVRE